MPHNIAARRSIFALAQDRLLGLLVQKSDPQSAKKRHYQAHIRRLAETSPHLLADIGLPDADAQPQGDIPRPDGGLHGRHF